MSRNVYAVALAGASCSGKTTIAAGVGPALGGGRRVTVLGIDAYYRDFAGVPEDAIEVDVPEAIEADLLVAHVRALRRGEGVERPVYDYATHTRARRGERVEPGDVLVVEGLFALYWEALRAEADLAVFVDVDPETALARRLERDTRERGRTPEGVVHQVTHKVRPMYARHVAPTRAYADLVLDGTAPPGASAARLAAEIRRRAGW